MERHPGTTICFIDQNHHPMEQKARVELAKSQTALAAVFPVHHFRTEAKGYCKSPMACQCLFCTRNHTENRYLDIMGGQFTTFQFSTQIE